jgi:hypothetical protein
MSQGQHGPFLVFYVSGIFYQLAVAVMPTGPTLVLVLASVFEIPETVLFQIITLTNPATIVPAIEVQINRIGLPRF